MRVLFPAWGVVQLEAAVRTAVGRQVGAFRRARGVVGV